MSLVGDIFGKARSLARESLMPIRTISGLRQAAYQLPSYSAGVNGIIGNGEWNSMKDLRDSRRMYLQASRFSKRVARSIKGNEPFNVAARDTALAHARLDRASAQTIHNQLRAKFIRANKAINELSRPRGPNSRL